MKTIIVPSVTEVEGFLNACQRLGIDSFDYPRVDDRWRQAVSAALKQCETSLHYGDHFLRAAAKLFCVLNMGHKLTDGNKRTSIITLAFFLFINERILRAEKDKLKNFAKKIANRRNSRFERAVKDTNKFIKENTETFKFNNKNPR